MGAQGGGRRLPGEIVVEDEGGVRVLCLRGELDSAVVADFTARHGPAPALVDEIDAGAVTFIGSAGLSVLVRCWQASVAAGRRPWLRASAPCVDSVLQISSLHDALDRVPPANRDADPPADAPVTT